MCVQAYGHYKPELRHHAVLRELAEASPLHSLVPEPAALLGMRWSLQAGAAAIPRARTLAQLEANRFLFWSGFEQLLPPSTVSSLRAIDVNRSLYGLHEVFVQDGIG